MSNTDQAIDMLRGLGADIDEARAASIRSQVDAGEPLGRAFTASGVPANVMLRLSGRQLGLPVIEDLSTVTIDPTALTMIRRSHAQEWGVMPLRMEGETLVLAARPSAAVNPAVNQSLEIALRRIPFRFELALREQIDERIVRDYRADSDLGDINARIAAGTGQAIDVAARALDLIIEQAIADRASDIHIQPGERRVYVRTRIDGVMVDREPLADSVLAPLVSIVKQRARLDITERRRPQDGAFTVTVSGRTLDVRVSTMPTVLEEREKIVMRILDPAKVQLDLSKFNFTAHNDERWRRGFTSPNGMLLVTGPTGSGKSTTLYATLNELARPEVNVITIEDPVEYKVDRITQVQVGGETSMTFASALRSALRADPDIVLVGEIRDTETARVAFEAALTGHLVLSTLHTNSAPETAVRLVEMGMEPYMVASVLRCVLAQRLVRSLCRACRTPIEPTDPAFVTTAQAVGFEVAPDTPLTLFAPVGCVRCSGTGYGGRLAIHETMSHSSELEAALVAARTRGPAAVYAAALAGGMTTMRQDGWAKVAAGLTTIAEIIRVAPEGELQ